ncbi:MAG TPA: hypothetical protein VLX90_03715, partial [Steroidobacteraceae bacterium]|nr:hypothetical protein [Steroidobacteraceae bacterium]
WQRMQQILSELLVALSSFDCHRALGLLAESVAEYSQGLEIRDYVWARKATALPHAADAKIADFVAKRRSTEAGSKPGLGQNPV